MKPFKLLVVTASIATIMLAAASVDANAQYYNPYLTNHNINTCSGRVQCGACFGTGLCYGYVCMSCGGTGVINCPACAGYKQGYAMMEKILQEEEARLRANPTMMWGKIVDEIASGSYQKAYDHVDWLAKNKDDAAAWLKLGQMNEIGLGTSKSISYAKTCYQNGANLGNVNCKNELKRINYGKYLGSDFERNFIAYHKGIVAMASSVTSTIDWGSPSSSSSTRRSSSGSCSSCGGTGVSKVANTGGSLHNWVAYYNSSGTKCPYCNLYSKHFHDKCPSCNTPSY